MRHLPLPLLALFALLLVAVAAWDKEDHEIFRIRDEIIATQGPNVTFYDFLGVKPSASQSELNKAFRRKSKQLHPDKVKRAFIANYGKQKANANKNRKPGVHVKKGPTEREIDRAVKLATEEYARLGVTQDILKGPGRERYDHFLQNGFPKWKGTGYYYSRFRPGLGTVLTGLFLVFGGAGHYAALTLSWKRQVEFVDRYIRHARRAAWGDEIGIKGIPGLDDSGRSSRPSAGVSTGAAGTESGEEGPAMPVNRKQKRMMEKETRKESKKGSKSRGGDGTSTPPPAPALVTGTVTPTGGNRKRVIAENGKVLIVDATGNVYLEEENEDGETEEFLLDTSEIKRPTIRDTMVYRLPVWIYQKTVSRFTGSADAGLAEDEFEDGLEEEEIVQEFLAPPSTTSGSRRKGGRRG
ncbi:hypothetical protein FQN57_007135 [Myotisia sp. PD_48]|nr:hypothetical protein FQN57_007135 [Myotisia sp. PD_48]